METCTGTMSVEKGYARFFGEPKMSLLWHHHCKKKKNEECAAKRIL